MVGFLDGLYMLYHLCISNCSAQLKGDYGFYSGWERNTTTSFFTFTLIRTRVMYKNVLSAGRYVMKISLFDNEHYNFWTSKEFKKYQNMSVGSGIMYSGTVYRKEFSVQK